MAVPSPMTNRAEDDVMTETCRVGPAVTTREGHTGIAVKKENVVQDNPDDVDKPGNVTGKRVFFMRHCERLDRIYRDWTNLSFTGGKYIPVDCNMPSNLPKRGIQDYRVDAPITEMGHIFGQMIGRACNLNRLGITHVYTSPAMRCIQSANAFSKAANRPQIKIEPGLYTCQAHVKTKPKFLTAAEAKSLKYDVDESYEPVMKDDELVEFFTEKCDAYVNRVKTVIDKILANVEEGHVPLIMGHADLIDIASRHLRGKPTTFKNKTELEKCGFHYPYSCMLGLEQLDDGSWKSIKDFNTPLTYAGFCTTVDFNYHDRTT